MSPTRLFYAVFVLIFFVPPFSWRAVSAGNDHFRVGAARVDITPAENSSLLMSGYSARVEGFTGIHDRLYVRALVLEDGTTKGAIVTYDLIGTPNDLWEKLSDPIAKRLDIPRENILLAGTHTHGAPEVGEDDPQVLICRPEQAAYRKRVEDSILQALLLAQANLQPATVGFGTGEANVNMNRVARWTAGRWWLGYNSDGASDKTVAVVKFSDSSGEPIALLANYAVHGTGMGQENYLLTADIPGATSRFVERHYQDRVPILWTSGAAGDQCPLYDREGESFEGVEVTGMLLGEEIIRVAEDIRTRPNAALYGAQRVVSCPGRARVGKQLNRTDSNYQFVDADPVPIRLSLLRIGKIALWGVSGEVFTVIGQRLKKESPLSQAMMLTLCNGSSGYVPSDDAYKRMSYEIQVTRLKAGCAEEAIVNGFLEMMEEP